MLDWSVIETVLLDMDGTLLDLHFDNHFWLEYLPKAYAEAQAMDHADALQELKGHFQTHAGTLNWYCIDFWSNLLGLDIEQHKHSLQDKIAYRPKAHEFLKFLQELGKEATIVTNAHPKVIALKLRRTDLANQVARIISSHDYNHPKEDQIFWQQLHKELPFDPGTTLLIDDSLAVLKAAQTYGITNLLAIHQPDSSKTGRSLEGFDNLRCFSDLYPD